MKATFTKTTTCLLAFLVLFSTFSFTVEKHYCGDFLVDVSYLAKAENCGMNMDTVAPTKRKNCCKDEVYKIEGQDELQQFSDLTFDFEKQQFLVAFYISKIDLFIALASKGTFYKDFSPPNIPIDYQVCYQTFLI
jgi:hypothetical protein